MSDDLRPYVGCVEVMHIEFKERCGQMAYHLVEASSSWNGKGWELEILMYIFQFRATGNFSFKQSHLIFEQPMF